MTSENQSSSHIDQQKFIAWTVLVGLLKLVLGVILPLTADESYYWVWSQHLDFGYFDHPPMVAWLFGLGSLLHLHDGVRIPAILIGHLTILIWAVILSGFLPPKKRLLWLGLFVMCPLTGFGGIIVTPDLPLILFWSLSLLFLQRILRGGKDSDFAGLGIALGLGFCSKYQIVLLPLSLLTLVGVAEVRRSLLRAPLLLTYLCGLLASAPVLGWNAQHQWASFAFQIAHGFSAEKFSWRWPVEYLAGETLLIFPTVLWAARKIQTQGKPLVLLLAVSGFLPVLFFAISSLRAPTELNWPAMGFPAIFAVAAIGISRRQFLSQFIFWIMIELGIVASVFLPLGFHVADRLVETSKYAVLRALPGARSPLFASTYQMASSLWFTSQIPVYKLRGMSRSDMFDRWEGSQAPHGRFYLLREEDTEQYLPPEAERDHWSVRVLESPAPGLELLEVNRQ